MKYDFYEYPIHYTSKTAIISTAKFIMEFMKIHRTIISLREYVLHRFNGKIVTYSNVCYFTSDVGCMHDVALFYKCVSIVKSIWYQKTWKICLFSIYHLCFCIDVGSCFPISYDLSLLTRLFIIWYILLYMFRLVP